MKINAINFHWWVWVLIKFKNSDSLATRSWKSIVNFLKSVLLYIHLVFVNSEILRAQETPLPNVFDGFFPCSREVTLDKSVPITNDFLPCWCKKMRSSWRHHHTHNKVWIFGKYLWSSVTMPKCGFIAHFTKILDRGGKFTPPQQTNVHQKAQQE